ncbi:ATP-binding cassette sub-family C member [Trichinella pseudospiralis]
MEKWRRVRRRCHPVGTSLRFQLAPQYPTDGTDRWRGRFVADTIRDETIADFPSEHGRILQLQQTDVINTRGVVTRGLLPPIAPGNTEPVSWKRFKILLTHPCETLNSRLMSHGRMPIRASSTMRMRNVNGNGLPLTNTPPSWFTSPQMLSKTNIHSLQHGIQFCIYNLFIYATVT